MAHDDGQGDGPLGGGKGPAQGGLRGDWSDVLGPVDSEDAALDPGFGAPPGAEEAGGDDLADELQMQSIADQISYNPSDELTPNASFPGLGPQAARPRQQAQHRDETLQPALKVVDELRRPTPPAPTPTPMPAQNDAMLELSSARGPGHTYDRLGEFHRRGATKSAGFPARTVFMLAGGALLIAALLLGGVLLLRWLSNRATQPVVTSDPSVESRVLEALECTALPCFTTALSEVEDASLARSVPAIYHGYVAFLKAVGGTVYGGDPKLLVEVEDAVSAARATADESGEAVPWLNATAWVMERAEPYGPPAELRGVPWGQALPAVRGFIEGALGKASEGRAGPPSLQRLRDALADPAKHQEALAALRDDEKAPKPHRAQALRLLAGLEADPEARSQLTARAVELDPNDARVAIAHGEARVALGDLATARKLMLGLAKRKTLRPSDAAALRLKLAALLRRAEHWGEASRVLEPLSFKRPDDPQLAGLRAAIAMDEGNLPLAESILASIHTTPALALAKHRLQVLSGRPQTAAVWATGIKADASEEERRVAAATLLKLGKLREARALATGPMNADLRARIALAAGPKGAGKARAALDEFLEASPLSGTAARARLMLTPFKKRRAWIAGRRELRPASPVFAVLEAEQAIAEGRPAEALAALEAAKQLGARGDGETVVAGQLALLEDRRDDARKAALDALKAGEGTARATRLQGHVALAERNAKAAADAFGRAMAGERNPHFPELSMDAASRIGQARAALETGQPGTASTALTPLIEACEKKKLTCPLDPELKRRAFLFMGLTLETLGSSTGRSRGYVKAASALDPKGQDPLLAYHLALRDIESGKKAAALQKLRDATRKARARDGLPYVAWLRLAEVATDLKKRKQGTDALLQYLERDPSGYENAASRVLYKRLGLKGDDLLDAVPGTKGQSGR